MLYSIHPFAIHHNIRGYVIPKRRSLSGKNLTNIDQVSLSMSIISNKKGLSERDISTKSMSLGDFNVLLGHGIIYFTIFYCTLNWLYYRNARESVEKVLKDKEENDKKNKEKAKDNKM